jgi:hypothetical protein
MTHIASCLSMKSIWTVLCWFGYFLFTLSFPERFQQLSWMCNQASPVQLCLVWLGLALLCELGMWLCSVWCHILAGWVNNKVNAWIRETLGINVTFEMMSSHPYILAVSCKLHVFVYNEMLFSLLQNICVATWGTPHIWSDRLIFRLCLK